MRSVFLIGYGNPGRLDDGLGPLLAAELETRGVPGLTVDSGYQLTVEDAASVAGHDVVVFVDADATGSDPFHFRRLQPGGSSGLGSHSVEPAEVLTLAGTLFNKMPEAYVLGIRGMVFDAFGEGLSPGARSNLDQAVTFIERVIREGSFATSECGTGAPEGRKPEGRP
jgi:hydrogenase maturation protease